MDTLTIPERQLIFEYLEASDVHCRFLAFCVENVLDPSFQMLCKVQKAHIDDTLVTLAQFLDNPEINWEGGLTYGTRNFPM